MKRFGRNDLYGHIKGACDSASRALKLKYSVRNREEKAVALFRPVDDVKVFVRPYVGSCDAVDTVFKNGKVFGNYADIIRRIGEVDGWRLYAGDRKVGLKWFDEDYESNIASGRRVEIGIHIDSGGLPGVLMYMFSNMELEHKVFTEG